MSRATGTLTLGTDVGGTFTDLVFYAGSGELHCVKVPSTPSRPGASILDWIDEIRTMLGAGASWEGLSHTHSSTVATNALIERKGARVGMIVSSGFRDLFELQRLAIPHPMRFDSRRPVPLVPRALVREVGGRIGADGAEIDPLSEADAVTAANELLGLGCEIAVVVLLHAYHNPAHEQAVRAAVDKAGVKLRLELSSEVWPQAREYERAVVLTAVNASIRPIVEGYVERLDAGLAERKITAPARVARSNGGAELAATMRRRPVVALLSGPAAGVAGAAAAAQDAGWDNADLLTLDVGGTSADIGVIRGGRPVLSAEEHIADFPLLLPTIAVSSIGAGGGSILWLDPAGSLKVGPRSVGADPGPACYGVKGSTIPALTDAFLVAGLLAPGQKLGGKLPLQMAPAHAALDTLATPLGLSIGETADGAIRVAIALMAAEAASVLARRGVDAPRFRLVAFGGAGPLTGAMLAEEVGIDSILIPPFPGALSALGAARADLEGDLVEPVYERLGALAPISLAQTVRGLQARAQTWLAEQSAALTITGSRVELAADMRYDGQGYDVTVGLRPEWLDGRDFAPIREAFHAAHRATYGHANEGGEIWLKELRAHITGATPKPAIVPVRPPAGAGGAATRTVRLFGRELTATVHDRAALTADSDIPGPAIIDQMDTTTWIPEGWTGRVVASGALVLERG